MLIFLKRLLRGSLFLSKYLEKVEWLVYTIDQIKNRNFLSPTGFKFVLNRAPKVSFFGNEANIPDLNLGIAEQPTYLKDIPLPGDKVTFGDFNLRFLVDENLENYNEISNWIRSVGYAETLQDAFDFQNANPDLEQPDKSQLNFYSDGTLQILTSSENPNFKVVFQNLFPYQPYQHYHLMQQMRI